MSQRDIRYQAAVVAGGRLLLLRCVLRSGEAFWVLPGGGLEPGETEAACVAREVHEEARVEVAVGPVLYDVAADPPDGTYRRWRTYLCQVKRGEAVAGSGEGGADLVDVWWLPLDDECAWGPELRADAFLGPQVYRIREALRGHRAPGGSPAR